MIKKHDDETRCDICKRTVDISVHLSDGNDDIGEEENERLYVCKNCLLDAFEVIDE